MKTIITILTVLFLAAGAYAGDCCGEKEDGGCQMKTGTKSDVKTSVCPVCPMKITVTKDTPSSVYKGKTFYFMNKKMKEMFDKNQTQYLNKDLSIKGWKDDHKNHKH